jgi:hypothetical protein
LFEEFTLTAQRYGGIGHPGAGRSRWDDALMVACALIIEREIGPDEARRALRLAGRAVAS